MSLHYNGANSFVFINEVEIQKFKAKEPILSLQFHYVKENVSNEFSVDNMKKTGLYGYVYNFRDDYDVSADEDILDIHKYLMKTNGI